MRLRRPLIWMLGLLWLLAGCGVPTDPAPRSIPADNVPFGLLDAPTSTTTAAAATVNVVVYLTKDGRVAPVHRKIEPPATPAAVLAAMTAGPTSQEAAAGLRTALVSDVPAVEASGGIATVTLAEEHTTADVRDQILALAQLVWTLTDLDGIKGVRFLLGGRPTEVPVAQGSAKGGVITRADFADAAPRR